MNASHWKINATKDFFLKKNLGIAKIYVILQRCHWVFKSGWATSNVVGIICPPLVVIGLTELPNSGWAKAHPAHPLAAAL